MDEFKLYAVTGKPILFSRSPQIFHSLFSRKRINARYLRLASSSVSEVMRTAKEMKLRGLNVTSPFKEDVCSLIHEKGLHAQKIGAVNTITFQSGKSKGYNTDHYGVFHSLEASGIETRGKKCVVLGAGGAGRAAVYALQKSGAREVILVNRTFSRAQEASRFLGCTEAPFSQLPRILSQSDLLVSCVPRLSDCVERRTIPSHLDILDASYSNPSTENRRGRTLGGLDWLLYQALPAFGLFTGRKASHREEASFLKQALQEEKKDTPHIALVGFMGSGKSTVGKAIAEKLHWDFADTDQVIEEVSGRKIPEIFRREGEEKFRERERSLIPRMLRRSRFTVFSVGGGAVGDPQIREALQERCRVVWLWTSVSEALKRADLSSRPLLEKGCPERANQILEERLPLYARFSDVVFPSPTGKVQNTARRIIDEIHQTDRS